jgi:hypothetical protein
VRSRASEFGLRTWIVAEDNSLWWVLGEDLEDLREFCPEVLFLVMRRAQLCYEIVEVK